jgi:two-component system, sensor histidine kinase and response regulator
MYQILVIEDEFAVRSNIIKILSFERYKVIGAENGEIGYRLAVEKSPDLILCDVMMPEADGYEVRDRLFQNSDTATIPFIFLTAKTDRADVRHAMELGADDYLTKPFTRDELLGAVSAQLAKKAAADTLIQERIDNLLHSITESVPDSLLIPMHQIQSFLLEICQSFDTLEKSKILTMIQETYSLSVQLKRLLNNFLFHALLENASKNQKALDLLGYYRTNNTKPLITMLANSIATQYERTNDLELRLIDSEVPILAANLSKIIEELVDNAFKFSPTGTPILLESTIKGDNFNLHIENFFQELPSEIIESFNIDIPFNKMLQMSGKLGMGVGLARRLAALYGGEVALACENNQMISVRVSLPLSIQNNS